MKTAWDRLDRFLCGAAAAADLYARASQNGSFIEAVCLSANLIDAQLRLGLILKRQIQRGDRSIDVELLLQAEGDKPLFEKEIYAKALAEGLISQDLHDRLKVLYAERNRVVHRYIITDLKTEDVLEIGIRYEQIEREVREVVYEIEEQQIRLGVGITVRGPDFIGPEAEQWLADMRSSKHGPEWLSGALKRGRANKTPLPTPGKCPPSNHDQRPGAADL